MTEQEGLTIYGCNGTPVDCVKIAFDYLLQNGETPDLVLSGINHGANSAVNVLYSGTMGAAIEGSFYNIPSIGFSLLDHDEDADFGTVQQYILPIVRKAMTENLGRPLCLNVNVPNLPAEQIRGSCPAARTGAIGGKCSNAARIRADTTITGSAVISKIPSPKRPTRTNGRSKTGTYRSFRSRWI